MQSIIHILEPLGYHIYMINKILPCCRVDCRNYFAIHFFNIFALVILQTTLHANLIYDFFTLPVLPITH